MKRIISLVLSLSIAISLLGGLDISIFTAMEVTNTLETEFIDIDIYKAQCLAGIAEDQNSDAVEHCSNIYNYYINEELFSPTQTFLQEAYADETLMMNFNEWKAYSLGADASSAFNQPLAKKDYYESLIIALFSLSLNENGDIINDIEYEAAATATSVVDNLCAAADVTTEAALISYFSNASTSTMKSAIEGASVGTKIASDALFVIDIVLSASSTIVDAVERIALYSEMLNLDLFTKQWIEQMYNACDQETDAALKLALYNLKTSSASFAESLLVEISDSTFRVRTWAAGTTVNTTLGILAASNPISASVLAGLKLGKTICDIFYSTSDVYEQFYMLECIYDVEKLSRTVVKKCEREFVENVTSEMAKTFIYAVDCYFECLINVEVDCMIQFLDVLYNGGWLKGTIVWLYGATDDYQEAVNVLESLRDVRQNNYNLMTTYFKIALHANYPETYDYYFTVDNTIPINDISFMTSRILPPPYPSGYANMIVGDFANIDVQYVPSNTTQRAYTVTSDNPDVVEINDNVMTAVSVGTANVTVTSVENPDVSYTAEIKVGVKLEDTEIKEVTTWFTYTVNDNGEATITGLVDGYEPRNLTIPNKIDGYDVTRIDYLSFYDLDYLERVVIPSSVTSIGDRAFYSCSALTNIIMHNGLTGIGDDTFSECAFLTDIVIPDTVTSLGKTFRNCIGLKSLTMPASTKIYYYNDVTTFEGCENIERVTLTAGTGLMQHFGCDYSSFGYKCTPWYISGCSEVIIKEGVKNVSEDAFYDCELLQTIIIPNSVTCSTRLYLYF